MFAYCVEELGFSEDAASRRITGARTAAQFPQILPALTDGRLHLTAALKLAPHLTEATASELLEAAAHKSRSELEQLLAERFPRSDVTTQIRPAASALPGLMDGDPAPARIETPELSAPARIEDPAPRPREEKVRAAPSQLCPSARTVRLFGTGPGV